MTRVTADLVAYVSGRLTPRDRLIIQTVGSLRLVSAKQLERLCWPGGDPQTSARLCRRALQRLVDLEVLGRLERRVGGVRAGSSGYVYVLDRVGQRLYEPGMTARVRRPEESGLLFVRHTLAVTELFVRLTESAQIGLLELLAFEGEPEAWRMFVGFGGARLVVKPDAYARVGVGAYEDRYFFELDAGTHGAGAIRRKLDTYIAYWRSGRETSAHGVFPKVLWVATTEGRAAKLADWCSELPADTWKLFGVTTVGRFVERVTGEVAP